MNALYVLSMMSACCAIAGAGRSYGDVLPPAGQQSAVVERNPPGDIPDNQVFVLYRSPLGFSIKIPEGWARHETTDSVTFSDKYNTVAISVSQRSQPPTLDDIKAREINQLLQTGKAVRMNFVKAVRLPSGSAFVVSYASNSEPNAVTNKAIRLENDRYFFWKEGRLATLTLSAPSGADNADQWQLMARSFGWR
jgi:hypothetical protein